MIMRRDSVTALVVMSLCLAGCTGGSGGSARQRSSMLTLTAVPGGDFTVAQSMDIPIGGGVLALQSALFSLGRVHIEENTGEGDGEDDGQDGKGEKGGKGGKGKGGEGGEND